VKHKSEMYLKSHVSPICIDIYIYPAQTSNAKTHVHVMKVFNLYTKKLMTCSDVLILSQTYRRQCISSSYGMDGQAGVRQVPMLQSAFHSRPLPKTNYHC
jgi:hypothetical protein